MKKRRKVIKPEIYETDYIEVLEKDNLRNRDCCDNFFNKGEYFLDKAKEYDKKAKELYSKAKEYNKKALKCYNSEECKYEQKVKKCEKSINECDDSMKKYNGKSYINSEEYMKVTPFIMNNNNNNFKDDYYYIDDYIYNDKDDMEYNDDIIYIKSDCKTYVTPIYDMYYMQNNSDFMEKYPSMEEPSMNKNNNYFGNGFEQMWKEYCEMMNKMFNKMMKK